MKCTLFWDMHSGGGTKVHPYDKIYIEAPMEQAIEIFKEKFGRDPSNVTCSCCGEDYSVDEHDSLEEASAYHRGCDWKKGGDGYDLSTARTSLQEYLKRPDVLVIRLEELGYKKLFDELTAKAQEHGADCPDFEAGDLLLILETAMSMLNQEQLERLRDYAGTNVFPE